MKTVQSLVGILADVVRSRLAVDYCVNIVDTMKNKSVINIKNVKYNIFNPEMINF